MLDHAAEFLHEPDFVPTPEQRQAVTNAFRFRISVITGRPGVGKTRVLSLINFIASGLYGGEEEFPAWVIALAGRAASNAREAGTTWTTGGLVIPLQASTIHYALGLESEGDDGPNAFKKHKKISCGLLGIEEASMNSSPLLAAIVRGVHARHYVLTGDPDQLPPIGPGKPFRDILSANIIPTVWLTKNWRTDVQGIRDLCADIMTLDKDELMERLPEYEDAGGVEFVRCEWNERAARAASIVASLVDQGIALEEIAILGPHKDGDAGCVAANLAVREKLGFSPHRIVKGELLIITKNNYSAPTTEDPEKKETIYNGERCDAVQRNSDYLDIAFPRNSEGLTRRVSLLMADPEGDVSAQLPEHVSFGYAMSTHKAQGSQFDYVIVMAERGYERYGVVQGSNVYTAVSRARKKVFIVGAPQDFVQAATVGETPRKTLLEQLLVKTASN